MKSRDLPSWNRRTPTRLRLADDDSRRKAVEVLNPLVAGEGLMKTISLPEMLRFVDRNRRRAFTGPIRFFQLDRCFLERQDQALPQEPEAVVMVWAGPAETAHFSRESRPVDPYDARGELELLLESLGISPRCLPGAEENFYAPGSGMRILDQERELGRMGLIHPKVLRAYDLEGSVLHASLSLEALQEALPEGKSYNPVPVYPPVRRDLSLLVPEGVPYGAIAELLRSEGGEILETLDVFDLYEGEGIGSAERALGVRLVLRSLKETLKDKRVDNLLGKMLKRLELELKVKLRAE